ncbi:MAG: response regulator [bacterium]|nr:response regulator [bacterium]MDW8164759.1 response regulator [Candidatus Omnitrophota bacterium]
MGKILIITKEKILLEKFTLYLKGNGYECFGFLYNDKDLIDRIEKENCVDIAVLEIETPDIKTKKIVKEIKRKFEDCKFLILVSKFDKAVEEFMIEYGIDAYLVFPILPFQFLRAIYTLQKF